MVFVCLNPTLIRIKDKIRALTSRPSVYAIHMTTPTPKKVVTCLLLSIYEKRLPHCWSVHVFLCLTFSLLNYTQFGYQVHKSHKFTSFFFSNQMAHMLTCLVKYTNGTHVYNLQILISPENLLQSDLNGIILSFL